MEKDSADMDSHSEIDFVFMFCPMFCPMFFQYCVVYHCFSYVYATSLAHISCFTYSGLYAWKYLSPMAYFSFLNEDSMFHLALYKVLIRSANQKVQNVQVQYMIKNLQGWSIQLDIIAVDSEGKIYNIDTKRR